MASTANLSARVRSESGKGAARKLRAAGEIPAVVYGHGRQPQSLSVNARELEKLLSRISAARRLEKNPRFAGTNPRRTPRSFTRLTPR